MIRTQTSLPEQERNRLENLANSLGIPISELMRRIITEYLAKVRNVETPSAISSDSYNFINICCYTKILKDTSEIKLLPSTET